MEGIKQKLIDALSNALHQAQQEDIDIRKLQGEIHNIKSNADLIEWEKTSPRNTKQPSMSTYTDSDKLTWQNDLVNPIQSPYNPH